jgi:hypothetical protein
MYAALASVMGGLSISIARGGASQTSTSINLHR